MEKENLLSTMLAKFEDARGDDTMEKQHALELKIVDLQSSLVQQNKDNTVRRNAVHQQHVLDMKTLKQQTLDFSEHSTQERKALQLSSEQSLTQALAANAAMDKEKYEQYEQHHLLQLQAEAKEKDKLLEEITTLEHHNTNKVRSMETKQDRQNQR